MYPEPNTGLFLLKRAKRANGDEVADHSARSTEVVGGCRTSLWCKGRFPIHKLQYIQQSSGSTSTSTKSCFIHSRSGYLFNTSISLLKTSTLPSLLNCRFANVPLKVFKKYQDDAVQATWDATSSLKALLEYHLYCLSSIHRHLEKLSLNSLSDKFTVVRSLFLHRHAHDHIPSLIVTPTILIATPLQNVL